MVLDQTISLSSDTIVMYVVFHYFLLASVLTPYDIRVRTNASAVLAAKKLKIVHSPSDYFYLVTISLFLNRLPI